MLPDHIELVKRVARRLSSESGYVFLKSAGYKPGVPIVSAGSRERLSDVFESIRGMRGDSFFLAIEQEDSRCLLVLPLVRRQLVELDRLVNPDLTVGGFVEQLRDGARDGGKMEPFMMIFRDTQVYELLGECNG